jgi:3-isopropylmalate/(R)-2-methylmalate dehydratase large subunit
MQAKSLFEKVWEKHTVYEMEDGPTLLYIDRHFIHEVTSPQAFSSLRSKGRDVRRVDLTFATMDHVVSTTSREITIKDSIARNQINALYKNCKDFKIKLFDMFSQYQGIVHVIMPELGLTLPGLTIVCGDSHTSTHGAFGSLAFGIGTTEVEHVLATQCIWLNKPKSMQISVNGRLSKGVTAKDVILAIIGKIGTTGGNGYVIEYSGEMIKSFNMDERMTICNMGIEAGARANMIAPDEKTFEFIKGRIYSPKGRDFEKAVEEWKELKSDENAKFDKKLEFDFTNLKPQVTWGTNPAMVTDIDGKVPSPDDFKDENERKAVQRALDYMGLKPDTPITEIKIDKVFIGSCTNGRLKDLEIAAEVVKGRKVHQRVKALVVPGSRITKRLAEEKGLDRVFKDAGFEWRDSGCSMCLAMNEDRLMPKERCASTSNRNFEGRQGREGRTHLVSPAMAAAAAIAGHFVDAREYL